jgi:fused signal recognition particle receptor
MEKPAAPGRPTELPVGESGKKIDTEKVDELLWDLELGLLESDVALPVIEEIKNGVRANLVGKRIERGYNLGDVIEQALRDAIGGVLQKSEFDFDAFVKNSPKPVIIMFVGINGTGKTTAIAKISNRLQKQGYNTVLSASDTFRAGAIEQLTVHSERLGTKIIKHQSGGDPAAVAYDAVDHAKAKRRDVVLVDTAGRMQTNANLMDEMKKIKRVVNPNLVIFVGDSLAGNDAIEQAVAFDKAVGINAVILTKIDTDAKGGAALSIANAIGKPIAFLSTGQEYEDIIKFDSKWMLDRLFGE